MSLKTLLVKNMVCHRCVLAVEDILNHAAIPFSNVLFGEIHLINELAEEQKELLQEFDKQSSTETQPEAAGFFSKVKEFLDGLGNRQGSA